MRYEERQHWSERGSCAQSSFDAALWRVCYLLSSAASLPPLSAQDRHRARIRLAHARDMWVELEHHGAPKTYQRRGWEESESPKHNITPSSLCPRQRLLCSSNPQLRP